MKKILLPAKGLLKNAHLLRCDAKHPARRMSIRVTFRLCASRFDFLRALHLSIFEHPLKLSFLNITIIVVFCLFAQSAWALSESFKNNIYNTGELKPVDSVLKVKVGETAPDFRLKAVSGKIISLKDYYRKKNVVISFVPAAWTPVCSDQWPGYNIVKDIFDSHDAVLLGITVDNIPTLFSWTNQMGALWFEVLSDFWPHGAVAEKFGVLRSDGVSERGIFIIDKKGIIRFIDVHNINQRPPLETLVRELEKLN